MNPIFWKTIFMKTVLKDYLNWTFNRNFWNGLLNWTMNWFLNMNLDLINSEWTLNTISHMILRWLWDKPLLYDLLHDFETWLLVWYPSHFCFPTYGGTIGMSVMHHWHDSCVGEWFLTPSLFMIICRLLWLWVYDFEIDFE